MASRTAAVSPSESCHCPTPSSGNVPTADGKLPQFNRSCCTLRPQFWYVPELCNSGTYQNCLSHVAILKRTKIGQFRYVPELSDYTILVHVFFQNCYYNSGTYQNCPWIIFLLLAEWRRKLSTLPLIFISSGTARYITAKEVTNGTILPEGKKFSCNSGTSQYCLNQQFWYT